MAETVTIGDTLVEIRETDDGLEAVEAEGESEDSFEHDLFEGELDYAFFGDGGDYGVVLPEGASFEVEGSTVYFDPEDAACAKDAWNPTSAHGTKYEKGLHFSFMGSAKMCHAAVDRIEQ